MGTYPTACLTTAEYETLCEQGHCFACEAYAAALDQGISVAEDKRKAYEVRQKACDKLHCCSCCMHPLNQWVVRLSGDDLKQAIVKSRSACQRDCDAGDARSCYNLADTYHSHVGFQDPQRAKALFAKAVPMLDKACQAGTAFDCETLAHCHSACDPDLGKTCPNCPGFQVDEAKVRKANLRWVELLEYYCQDGCPTSCAWLGGSCEHGNPDHGVAKDENKALGFWKKACELGDFKACGFAERLKANR